MSLLSQKQPFFFKYKNLKTDLTSVFLSQLGRIFKVTHEDWEVKQVLLEKWKTFPIYFYEAKWKQTH